MFVSFLKHLLPGWKRNIEVKQKANAAILAAIDRELKETELDTIEGKIVMYLDSSIGKWLDQYGRLFGLLRRDNETDDVYRQRIINYVLLERGTVPAIKKAIQEFLQDYESYLEIYEPYRNIFRLNKSKLNGEDHLMGEYYNYAVIDVKFSKPFPIGIIDVINDFKPAGVKVHLTYRPEKGEGAGVIELPLENSEVYRTNTRMEIMNGMNDRIRGHLNLTERSRSDVDGSEVFTLNESKLNSLDRLAGAFSVHNPSYNLASFSTQNLQFDNTTTVADVVGLTESVSPDFYIHTGIIDSNYASVPIGGVNPSYLYITLDLATYLNLNYDKYLREISPNGVYIKSTYLALVGEPNIYYSMKTTTPITKPIGVSIEILNPSTKVWSTLDTENIWFQQLSKKIELTNLSSYLADEGLVFTRLKMNKHTDLNNVDLHLHFFELGFMKDIAVRTTIEAYDGDVTASSQVFPEN